MSKWPLQAAGQVRKCTTNAIDIERRKYVSKPKEWVNGTRLVSCTEVASPRLGQPTHCGWYRAGFGAAPRWS